MREVFLTSTQIRRWRLLGAVAIVLAAGAVTFVATQQRGSNQTFDCHGADMPTETARLTIRADGSGGEDIILKSKGISKTFIASDMGPDYISASSADPNGNSFYFNTRTGEALETISVSDVARHVLLERCHAKLDANICLARLDKILNGSAFDRTDCLAPTSSECERWDSRDNVASEVKLICKPH